MSTHDRSAGSSQNSEHGAIAPLLALRATGLLDAGEIALVERHMASCPACQQDAALDDALASQLRHALLPATSAAPALRMEEIMRAASETRAASTAVEDAPEARPAAAGLRAARLRPAVARWGSGLPAIAAALALILFAAYIFGRFAPMGGVFLPARITPTPTLSPLLAQRTVYLPTDVGVYALRASDGAVQWTYPAGIATAPITHSQAIFGIALDHGTLYALAATPGQNGASLLALNAASGAVRWHVSIPNLWTGSQPQLASLLQAGNLLIVATHGPALSGAQDNWTVEAFGAANGTFVWSRALDEAPLSSPAFAGGSIFIGTATHVIALNASNGATRWTTGIIPSAYQQGTAPASVNSSVALAALGSWVHVLAKRTITTSAGATWEANYYEIAAADGSHAVRVGYENDPGGETVFAPTPSGDMVFVPELGGIDTLSTGLSAQNKWDFVPDDSTDRDHVMTGAAAADGALYTTDLFGVSVSHNGVSSVENFTYAIRASDGAELWRTPTDGGLTASTPVVASGLVLAPSRGIVRALRAGDGYQLWMYVTPGGSAVGAPLLG